MTSALPSSRRALCWGAAFWLGLLLLQGAGAASCPELAEPVCGADGLTYYNECLAKYQGVKVEKKGYCKGAFLSFSAGQPGSAQAAAAAGAAPAAAAAAGAKQRKHRMVPKERAVAQLSEDVMDAFTSDGFTYLGRMQLSKAPSMHSKDTAASLADSGLQLRNGHPVLPAHVSALRYTPEGHIYVLKHLLTRVVEEKGSVASRGASSASSSHASAHDAVILPNIPPSAHVVASISPNASANPLQSQLGPRKQGRSLSIIVGSDDRKICPTGAPYPYSAIGQIDFVERNTPYICTGTLLTTSLVLTAAHCVWDVESQTFADVLTYAPGRYRTADGKVVNPHGQYKWSHATLMKSYLTSGEGIADFALIKLDGVAPAAAGTMGLKSDCTNSSKEEKGLPVTTAGYPSDKPDGECDMALCSVDFNCSSESTRHSCDTYMGQSGSAFWDSKFFIRGVHVRGLIDENINEFTTIGPRVLAKIKEWEAQDIKATAAAIGAKQAALASGKSAVVAEQEGVKAGTSVSAPGLNSMQS